MFSFYPRIELNDLKLQQLQGLFSEDQRLLEDAEGKKEQFQRDLKTCQDQIAELVVKFTAKKAEASWCKNESGLKIPPMPEELKVKLITYFHESMTCFTKFYLFHEILFVSRNFICFVFLRCKSFF